MNEGITEEIGKLGFGLMRLPRSAGRIDIAQVSDMVDEFLAAGFNYFDTARIYPGSETAAHKALANPSPEVRALFDAAAPGASYASWAVRFAASLDGVLTVLSGMSNLGQVRDNVSYMRGFAPLTPAELEVIRQVREALGRSRDIPCTACGYCLEGCPKRIAIPDVFAAMNKQLVGGQLKEARDAYRAAAAEGVPASACIACGKCEAACPQRIGIIAQLRECAQVLEG